MERKLRWGILSTGRIAGVFARGLGESKTGTLVAVGSRSKDSADRFGTEFGVDPAHRHATYAALLADRDVDAVYIAPPHTAHAEWAIKAADAGKHMICEKPLTINAAEAMAVIEACRRNKVFLMEAFMYRAHPMTRDLVKLVKDGAIGEIRFIQAAFSFQSGWNPEGRLLNPALGGGGIMDVGCYPVSLARLIAGAAAGRDFLNPVEVTASGTIGKSGVDEWAAANLKFENGIVAQVSTGVMVNQENVARIYGSKGWILVPSPWGLKGEGEYKIMIHRQGADSETLTGTADRGSYAFEADAAATAIFAGKTEADAPAMTPADTLGNMRTLDRWRELIKLQYPMEKLESMMTPVHGRPLAVRTNAPMTYGEIPGLNKKISRLVIGTMAASVHGFVMFDEFFEQGGNAFDTAYIYGGGSLEKALGWWIRNRGVREQTVIVAKGAHSPHCNPKALSAQLLESLERMQTSYADVYFMHRDNPDVPVGEFVDVLNEHHQAGRVKVFGGSNWTMERLDAANEYAKQKGLVGFGALSNNFSLARMVEAPWGGCLASSDPAWRAWLNRTKMPLFSWSSQARGFFARGNPADTSDQEMVRCWYADDNFERLKRAKELGAKKGVEPVNIAAAYVLHQPFPVWALIGPATPAEISSCTSALPVTLTPDELKYLNLE